MIGMKVIVGQIVSGGFGELLIRQKSSEELQVGELLVSEEKERKQLLQVFDLEYGSQISGEARELVSGMKLEGHGEGTALIEKELRNYVLAKVKGLVTVKDGKPHAVKSLPAFFSTLRRIEEDDLSFLDSPKKPLFLGYVRSGSKTLSHPVIVDGEKVLSHHILIPASTGRGKSNLVKVMLWSLLDSNYCGVLVLDAHGEYQKALSTHPKARDNLVSYSTKAEGGAVSLRINKRLVKPWHLRGVVRLSEAQEEAVYTAYREKGDDWVNSCLSGEELPGVHEGTICVLQRKMKLLLKEGLFVDSGSETLVDDVVAHLQKGRKVIIDTSTLGGETELLATSIFASAVFNKARSNRGKQVSIVLEEAPRVLSEAAGANVFSTIAREGRKFGVGLIAITQLASLIPKEVLANLNTKIILGNEMKSEREAIIGSAAQDLSNDFKAIGALDKGEAIVSSVFTACAVPIKVPLFEDYATKNDKPVRKEFVL